MSTDSYTVPDQPADPETAAYELIVRVPCDLLGGGAPELRETLQLLASALHAESAFSGMTWNDAKAVAVAVAFDALHADDIAQNLRARAHAVATTVPDENGTRCGVGWNEPARAVHALEVAARVVESI